MRHTSGNKKLYDKRKETIERLFGTAKEHHGFRYTQQKGKARMEMKVGFTFACLNLKKLAFLLDFRDMALYETEFDALFEMLKDDLIKAKSLTIEQIGELVSSHYEQISYKSPKTGEEHAISQYPTYYLGCYLFGLIDHVFGKERLFEVLAKPEKLIDTYNEAVNRIGSKKLLTR